MINIKEFLGLEYYISSLDKFLIGFDKAHPKLSASQRAEREKYDRIYRLRDRPEPASKKEKFWEQF